MNNNERSNDDDESGGPVNTTLLLVHSPRTTTGTKTRAGDQAKPDRVAAVHVEIADANTKRRRDQGDEAVLEPLLRERPGRAAVDRRRLGKAAEVRASRHGRQKEEGTCDGADRGVAAVREVLRRAPARKNAGVYENGEGHARNKHAAAVAAFTGSERVAVRRFDGCLA